MYKYKHVSNFLWCFWRTKFRQSPKTWGYNFSYDPQASQDRNKKTVITKQSDNVCTKLLQDGFLRVYLRRRIRVYQRNYGFFCQILRVDSNSYSKSLLLQKPRCVLYLKKRLICIMIKTKINCKYYVISVLI